MVTRDVWSLRFNTNFEFQQNTLTLLQTSLSENNLFGWRKYLSVGFDMDQGSMAIGPTYFDPNIAGTRLTLWASARLTYARDTRDYEGNFETFSLAYPLYSLASRWGAEIDVSHQNVVVRHFQGNDLRLEDVDGDADDRRDDPVRVPAAGRDRRRERRALLRAERDPAGEPRSPRRRGERRRAARLPVRRDDGAALPRRVRAGAGAALGALPALSTVHAASTPSTATSTPSTCARTGSSARRWGCGSATGCPSWGRTSGGSPSRQPELGGRARRLVRAGAAAGVGARLREGLWIDQIGKAQLYARHADPRAHLPARGVGRGGRRPGDTQRRLFFLGGSTGLRGYAIGALQGTTMTIAHAELRTLAVPDLLAAVRGAAVLRRGRRRPAFDVMTPYQDLGIGLRWLIPQLNSSVWRFDWAFAFRDAPLTRAGWPGRFSAGFEQVF